MELTAPLINENINAAAEVLLLNETGTGTTALNSPSITAGSTVTLATGGATTFGVNVNFKANPEAGATVNGAITVTESTVLLTAENGDSFQANGNTAGSITLLAKANFANPPAGPHRSMLSAISAIKPLRSIVASKHPEARRISIHMLKTAAAMVQVKAGLESYQKVRHSRLAAYLSQN